MIIKESEELIEFFRNEGISLTRPRIDIGMLLLSMPQHRSSAEIIDMVKEGVPYASRATIYNTLNLFEEYGLIERLDVSSGKTIYDSNTDPHHHMYNEKTGDIMDLHLSSEMEEKVLKSLQLKAPKKWREKIKNGKLHITLHIT